MGISFIGANHSEPTLLALAYALEQVLDVRVPPTFPGSVELPPLPVPESHAPASDEASGASASPAP